MAAPLTVFLTTWNTGLQGSKAQEQDLISWLMPVLHQATEESRVAPDIYAIGVQELLPLYLAFAGLSLPVLIALTDKMESLLSAHATSLSPDRAPVKYKLVSRVSHVGVALWVFAREDTTRGRLGKPMSSKLGLWHLGMGNKGAVGLRLPIMRGAKEGGWETLTFVSAHLEAHDHNIAKRNAQYDQILSSLLFKEGDPLGARSPPYDTSHLFIMGDLNYRLKHLPVAGVYPSDGTMPDADVLALEKERVDMAALDTLRAEQRAGRVFGGMREGDITRFAPTYKRIVGAVEGYSPKRIPGWTDRIFFASYTDTPDLYAADAMPSTTPDSATRLLQFSSTPEITLSDHKPVHALLLLPPATHSAPSPVLAPVLPPPPPSCRPRPPPASAEEIVFYKIVGTTIDRLIGWPWSLLVLLGFGNEKAGVGVGAFLALVWSVWWTGVLSRLGL